MAHAKDYLSLPHTARLSESEAYSNETGREVFEEKRGNREKVAFDKINYTASRIDGHRIYGLYSYTVNFWWVPNGMGFHTIKNLGFMVIFG